MSGFGILVAFADGSIHEYGQLFGWCSLTCKLTPCVLFWGAPASPGSSPIAQITGCGGVTGLKVSRSATSLDSVLVGQRETLPSASRQTSVGVSSGSHHVACRN